MWKKVLGHLVYLCERYVASFILQIFKCEIMLHFPCLAKPLLLFLVLNLQLLQIFLLKLPQWLADTFSRDCCYRTCVGVTIAALSGVFTGSQIKAPSSTTNMSILASLNCVRDCHCYLFKEFFCV